VIELEIVAANIENRISIVLALI